MNSKNGSQLLENREGFCSSYMESHDRGSSTGKCCCFLSVLFLTLVILAAAIVVILLFLKPKKPIFHLHSIQLDPFKYDTTSDEEVNHSCSVVSLLFATQNPNKLGIRYSSSVLGVSYKNSSIAVIEVPTFYQPPNSRNLTVLMHALYNQLNITRILNEELAGNPLHGDHMEIRITGRIRARPHVLNFPLPKLKVSLDCRISMNYSDIMVGNKGVHVVKMRQVLNIEQKVVVLDSNLEIVKLQCGFELVDYLQALLLSSFPHFSQKCSLSMHKSTTTNCTDVTRLLCN